VSIARVLARIQAMVARAIVARVDDAPQWQEVQIELLEGETLDAVEHVQPYGLAAHPKPGAEAIVVALGGVRSAGIVIACGDRRYRLKGLQEGEVALYDDLEQRVHLTRDGIVISSQLGVSIETEGDFAVTAGGAVSIEGASVTIDSDGQVALNSDDVLLGNGAAQGAARVNDPIHVNDSRISGGSSKVRIG
jgi:phage baseplate assembly protein V